MTSLGTEDGDLTRIIAELTPGGANVKDADVQDVTLLSSAKQLHIPGLGLNDSIEFDNRALNGAHDERVGNNRIAVGALENDNALGDQFKNKTPVTFELDRSNDTRLKGMLFSNLEGDVKYAFTAEENGVVDLNLRRASRDDAVMVSVRDDHENKLFTLKSEERQTLRNFRVSSGLTYLLQLETNARRAVAYNIRLGFSQSAPVRTLQQSDLHYRGAFRVPGGHIAGSRFGYGGTALTFNPKNDSLFIVGHAHHQQVAEISIPEPVKGDIADLPIASLLQPFEKIKSRVPNYDLELTVKIGGLQVIGDELYGTLYEYYDAAGNAPHSHFKLSSLQLATASVDGLFRVGADINPGFVAGYMAEIPPEWQDEFGVPYLTGQAGIPIISRTSAGPAALGFDPSALGPAPAPVTPMVYYPLAHRIAPETSQNPIFNLTTDIDGVLFPRNARSVIFFGTHGTGPYCYGTPQDCDDPVGGGKGPHAYPYVYRAWAYDVLDLLQVKNGQKQPWEVRPYGVWTIDLPYPVGNKRSGGVAYDPLSGRVFISQMNADSIGREPSPVIHVFEVSVGED